MTFRFAERMHTMKPSTIREMLKMTERPDVISFAGGLPAPELFPVDDIRMAAERVLVESGAKAFQYGVTQGIAPLREQIAQEMARRDIPCTADDVLITTGSQQGLDLLGKIFIDAGDAILTENPTYLAAIQSFQCFQARFQAVPTDNEGLIPEAVGELANKQRFRFLYVIPNFQNPTGRLLSEERRYRLAERARELDLMILEDDPYGALSYDGETPPSIRSLAPERTVYMGSFSKVLAPGLRLGYVIAPAALRAKLVQVKQATDLHTSTLAQMVVYDVVKDGFLDTHIPTIRKLYREQCAAMLGALSHHMPSGVTWNKPRGGMFLWAELPRGMDASAVLARAIEQNVAFVPGAPFFAADPVNESLRLAFVTVPPPRIEEGVARLAEVIRALA